MFVRIIRANQVVSDIDDARVTLGCSVSLTINSRITEAHKQVLCTLVSDNRRSYAMVLYRKRPILK